MFKLRDSIILGSGLLSLWAVNVCSQERVPVAGEILDHSSDKTMPAVKFDPHPNITGFMTPRPVEKNSDDIYFSANEIQNDNETNIITAIGDVYVIRSDGTIKADKIVYNQELDVITATGNVVIVDSSDNVIYADELILRDQMSQGTLKQLKVLLRDESQVWASKVKTLDNNDKVMYDASYSPCDCQMEGKNKKEPLWKITASKIRQDTEGQNVYYRNAFLKVKNVPVFYTPFLSHADPSVKRRSGLTMPTYGSSNFMDTYVKAGYFWAIDDHSDLTVSPYFTTKHGVIPEAVYNMYTQKGDMSLQGSIANDKDKDKKRGHIFAKGRYEINDKWLAHLDAKYVSDSIYLRDISLPEKTDAWLTSNMRVEYFNNRDYANIEANYFRTISYNLRKSAAREKFNGSYVLPYIDYEKYNQLTDFGLYTKNTFNFASVVYNKEHSNSERGTMINEVVLPYTSPWGEKMRLSGSVKSDFYYVDNYLNPSKEVITGSTARVFPQLAAEWKLPFIKANEESRQIIEPVIVGVFAPNDNNKTNRIPNLDSENAFLDDVNVLDIDRYSGYDLNDTGSRVSYGFNWNSYGNILGRTQAFFAQSYYFDDENSFSQSLGERNHFSDYVGRIYANPSSYLDLNYRFRLDKNDWEIKYNELGARIGPDILNFYVSYIHLNEGNNAVLKNGLKAERHELYTAVNAKLTRDWSI